MSNGSGLGASVGYRLIRFARLLLYVGAVPALLYALVMFWMVGAAYLAPPLSPVLALVYGVPGDTRFRQSFKDGVSWRYCRDVPSGRVTTTELATFLEYGRRCEAVPPVQRDLVASLERPAFSIASVHGEGEISFATPQAPDFDPSGVCRHALSPAYLSRARALLSEANALPDLPDDRRNAMRAAEASVTSFSIKRLTGDGGWCRLDTPDRSGGSR